MPKAFEDCVKRGGRVRTVRLSDSRYKHVCYIDGKSFAGETKVKKQAGAVNALAKRKSKK